MNMPPPVDIEVRDEIYRRVDGVSLQGRLYRPLGTGPYPLVLDVHGGAWTTNDRLNNCLIDRFLASRGIAVFAIDFRMPPAHRYPVAAWDVNHAIRWLKQHAEHWGSRREWVGGLGTSSGGHLLMLSVMRGRQGIYRQPEDDLEERDATLPYVMLAWPVLDPLARYRLVRERHNERLIQAHHAFWPDEAAMADANPLRILQRGEPAFLASTLLLQGTADQNFDFRDTVAFHKEYQKAGGRSDIRLYENDPHSFIKDRPDSAAAKAALEAMHAFVLAQSG